MANETLVRNLTNDTFGFVDAGQYFTANSLRTGIANNATVTAFSATNPWITIFNKEAVGGKSIFLDYITMSATAAGTAGASLICAVTLDQGNRFTSGGTALTPTNPNFDASLTSIATINAGDLTATAASTQVRNPVGQRYLKGAIPVAGDEYTIKFGGVDAPTFLGISTIIKVSINVPKIKIGPQETGLIYMWLPSQSAASSYLIEAGWVERQASV